MKEKLIYHLENECNWDKFFGVAYSVASDIGFKSSADNFIKSKIVETAFGKTANMERVDEKGWDFNFQNVRIELKTCGTLLQKKKGNQTTSIKMKNFRGEVEKSSTRFMEEKCFDYLICIGIKDRNIIVVDDEVARSKYEKDGDGMFAKYQPEDYYLCKINITNPYVYNTRISNLINSVVDGWIDTGEPPNTLMKYF